jgi:Zn-dependent peptidase ImmA (M78 family)
MTNQNKETIFEDLIKRTLAKMPSEFATWVKKKIAFVFPKEEELARTVPKNDSKHYEAVICLHDELLTKDESSQEYYLLHEIAHVKLKHKTQSDAEKKRKQEDEANALAWEWWTKAQSEEARKEMKMEIERRFGFGG